MSNTVFISKNPSEIISFQRFVESNEMTLIAESFLRFSPVSFTLPQQYDILFFGSPRAVMFFKAQREIPKGKMIACVGDKTEALLRSMGHEIAFNGGEHGNIYEVAAAFASWSEDQRVLFPVSSRTLGTIANAIPEKLRETVTCYDTIVDSKVVPPCDVYVFTSPSNVEGYFKVNQLPEGAKVVAWGASTDKELKSRGVDAHILAKPDLSTLEQAIQSLITP